MIRRIFLLTTFIFIAGCKSDKNSDKNKISEPTEILEDIEAKKPKSESQIFESKLVDYRELDNRFNKNMEVHAFGIQIPNDSTMAFVFRLNKSTIDGEVEKYSFALKGFYNDNTNIFRASFNPSIKKIGDNKYIQLWHKKANIKYFDSLQVFIYERNNWKNSGKLGGFTFSDILIE